MWHDPIAVRHADECVTAKNGTVAATALAHDKTAHGQRQNRIRPSVKSRRKPVNKVLDDVFAELDPVRRSSVAEIIRGKKCQVFVATPRAEDLPFAPDLNVRLDMRHGCWPDDRTMVVTP